MSRHITRSKNKRHRADGGDETSSEILRRIHLTGEVTQNDICQLYMINKPVCQGCRVNSRDSPNCFCGLIPPSSGVRKSGLWQKQSDLISSLLGADPCEDHRAPTERPAGLTNVGATCYANSILQCLYMNVSFRAGIFSVEPDLLDQHPVLDQLARLFALLHSSEKVVIDSAPFVKTLELDKGSQQDSHEFLTLFLSLLEHSLSHSKVPKARTLIQDLFRGSVSHVTWCSMCGKDSEASSKMEDFYGLELNIKGLNNLEESLDDYLSIEQLFGENQYFCQSCGRRADATRCIKLRALPSVLIFQLKRYDFLMETTKKKKITSSFSFPRQLSMGRRLGDVTESELLYDLSAILIHKGAAANSGHYVARIKDENSGQWWEFDDEVVSKLGPQPFGGASSNSSANAQPTLQSEAVQSLSNGNHNITTQKLHFGSNNSQNQEIFSPTDAYMLMYNRTSAHRGGKGSETALGATGEHADAKLVSEPATALPSHLSEEIEKLNARFAEACSQYKSEKDKMVSYVTERRREVKSILSEAPVHSVEDSFFWVSTDWLRHWADNVDPGRLDNGTIQCSHGKVAVNKVTHMKRISTAAWSSLLSKYGVDLGGSPLNGDDYCIECLKEEARNSASVDDYRGRRAAFKEVAEMALAGQCPDGATYYVSRTWLTQWLRRKNVDSPCEADAGPTASLRCPHGNLLPEQSPGAKRVQVPESLWLFLSESANAVKPDDLLGCSAFCSDSQICEACSTKQSEVACLEGFLREMKLKQRHNHEKLFAGKNITLCPGQKYFLVPSSWLTKWRAYITTTGKNISSSVEPENLSDIIDSLKCEKHARLLVRPGGLVCRRGLITQRLSNNVATVRCDISGQHGYRTEKKLFVDNRPMGFLPRESLLCMLSQDSLHWCSAQQVLSRILSQNVATVHCYIQGSIDTELKKKLFVDNRPMGFLPRESLLCMLSQDSLHCTTGLELDFKRNSIYKRDKIFHGLWLNSILLVVSFRSQKNVGPSLGLTWGSKVHSPTNRKSKLSSSQKVQETVLLYKLLLNQPSGFGDPESVHTFLVRFCIGRFSAGLTIIPESDWKLFCEEWKGVEEKGISSEIVLTMNITNKLAGSCEEMPVLEDDLNPSNDEIGGELDAKDFIIKTDPDICEDCIGERESCELMHKLNYCNEEITVHLVRGKEVPRSLLEASANISEPDRRTSKRSRRTSSGKIGNLKVSGTTSVYQLKMMIWEYFGVVKENQTLHKGSIEIEDDSATLADKNIFVGDVLWVTDSEIHENRDIADELSEQKGESQHAKEGFHGTLLSSDVSFQERHDHAVSS